MMRFMNLKRLVWHILAFVVAFPSIVQAQGPVNQNAGHVGYTGISGLWVLANFSYAGMRAQNNPSSGWRIISFIFGFPGTFLTWLAVAEGSERAYGVDVPKK